MSEVTPPSGGEPVPGQPAHMPPPPPAQAYPATPPPPPGAPTPPPSGDGPSAALSIVAISLAGVALLLSFLGPASFLAWIFALPAFIVGIVALARKAAKRGLAITAIVVSILAFIISIVVFIVSLANAVDDALEDAGTSATVKEESADDASPDADVDDSDARASHSEDAGASGSIDSPIGAGVVWEYDSSWFGEDAVVWDGTFDGVVEVEASEYNDEQGSCYVIVGSITPTSMPEGENFTSWIDAPTLSLVAGGAVQDTFGMCETDDVEAAGYKMLIEAEVGLDTEFKFYSSVFVPDSVGAAPEYIVVGDASSADALYATPVAYELP